MGFTFNDLKLDKVEVSGGGSGMAVGKHVVKITEAKLVDKPNGAVQVEVKHDSLDGLKSIRNWITLHNPNSQQNADIGQQQFKALLVHGGHSDPNNIGSHGVGSVVGLYVGVHVVFDEWKNNQAGTNNVYTKVKSYVPTTDADPTFKAPTDDPLAGMATGTDGAPAPKTTTEPDLDDDIPF